VQVAEIADYIFFGIFMLEFIFKVMTHLIRGNASFFFPNLATKITTKMFQND